MKMPFGKYKGKDLDDVPTDYIQWALENMDHLNGSLQTEMENQLKLREGEGVVRQRGSS